mmetsp:Transcript_4463/g.12142  ORF Transcript_4463/g.12142 Transcript_4463/m.12142 type:complete len:92 (+) Transcript_4463:1089-1364(+)
MSTFSELMNGPPGSDKMEAVPKRTNLPEEVTGRTMEVPGLPAAPARNEASKLAVPTRPLDEPVLLLVPGRAKPVTGLPELVIGRTAGDIPP